MTPTVTLHGLGACVELTLAGSRVDELADAVHHAWSRCLAPLCDDPVPAEGWTVTHDGPAPGAPPDADTLTGLLQGLTQQVTRALIAARAGELLLLHAGAVTHPDTGATLVCSAAGGTGKTTLVSRLGRRLGYVTDETVGVDTAGRVWPYPKPLSVRTPDGRGLKRETSPDELGLRPAHPSPVLRQVVLLDRRSDAHPPAFRRLGLADAIVGLVPETSSLSALPRPLHLLRDHLELLPPVVRLSYAEADDVLDGLADLLEDA